MQPPQVQTLDQLMSATNPIYDPQRQDIQSQIGQTTDAGQAAEQGLAATQNNAFQNIAQMASNKGMLFSGFTPDQQAKYNAGTYMPALANLKAKVGDNIAKLQSALIGLDTDQRKGAMSEQANQQSQVADFNKMQDQRAYDEQVRQEAYQQELKKIDYQNSTKGSAGLSPYEMAQLVNNNRDYIAKNYKQTVGQGDGGGMAYTGPGGAPLSAHQYSIETGRPLTDVLAADATPYAQAARAIISGDWNTLGKIAPANNLPMPPAAVRNNPDALATWLQQRYPKLF